MGLGRTPLQLHQDTWREELRPATAVEEKHKNKTQMHSYKPKEMLTFCSQEAIRHHMPTGPNQPAPRFCNVRNGKKKKKPNVFSSCYSQREDFILKPLQDPSNYSQSHFWHSLSFCSTNLFPALPARKCPKSRTSEKYNILSANSQTEVFLSRLKTMSFTMSLHLASVLLASFFNNREKHNSLF